MSDPRVSIGLPVYNGESYLREAVSSVLEQTFTDFELVISDNASTDSTEEISRAFAKEDRRVRYARNDRNLGGAPNYNRCYTRARPTEYYKWISHDDVIAPTYLERCVAALEAEPAASVAFPQITYIDSNGSLIGAQAQPDLSLLSDDAGERSRTLVRHQLASTDIFWAIFGLMRRTAIDQSDLHGSYVASDQVMLYQLVLAGKFVQVRAPLYFRREHPDASMTKHKTPRERAQWFDTSARRQLLLPHWTLFGKHLGSIRRYELGPAERARCYGAIGYRILKEWRNLGGDVKLVLRDALDGGSRG